MIIRCPECSTGFKLPDERVTSEGTKLKCSKCEHIFRVRDGGQGEPEIYYKQRDRVKNQQQSEGDDSSPFPNAGMDLKPKKKSAFGDLGADEDEMAAFQSAFDNEETGASQEGDSAASSSEPSGSGSADSGEGPALAAETEGTSSSGSSSSSDDAPGLTTGSSGAFGDPQDHVDPSFGEGGAYFDPEEGKVDDSANSTASAGASESAGASGPPNAAGPPSGASGPPPTAQPARQPKGPPGNASSGPAAATSGQDTGGSKEASEASSSAQWDDDDFEAHNIGGSAGKKFVTFLLLLSFVLMGFVGVVAYLNDGFIDFYAAPEMIEVAFADGEYEPRPEWGVGGPPTQVVQPSESVEVEGVRAELVSVGGDDIFVVQGMVRNHDDQRADDIELRAMIMTPEERTMTEVQAPMQGADVSIGQFRELQSTGDIDGLLSEMGGALEPGEVQGFTMVFDDLPERVQDGDQFTYRVEIADKQQG